MRRYSRCLIGFLLAVFVFGRLGKVLEANLDGNQTMKAFYRLERNTADVIFYGSSHIYAGVNIVRLWDSYGIAACNLAGTMQTLWNTYYNIEESLKYQKPEMIVVDLYGALIEDEYCGSTNVIKNVSSMRFSWNKIKNVWSSVPHEEFLSYLLSYPLMHASYSELKRGNYERISSNLGGEYFKGFMPSDAVTEYERLPEIGDNVELRRPTDKNREYLEKIVSVSKEHDIPMAFIVVPYWGIKEDDSSLYAWIENFAEENNILFLDGNRKLKEMDFDPKEDFAEESHLNYNGACKFTDYLGQWIKVNCDLEDHRGDERYVSWEKYSESWAASRQNKRLHECVDLEEYVEMIGDCDRYEVIIAFDDHFRVNKYTEMIKGLAGIDQHDLQYDCILAEKMEHCYISHPREENICGIRRLRTWISLSCVTMVRI